MDRYRVMDSEGNLITFVYASSAEEAVSAVPRDRGAVRARLVELVTG